MAPARVSRQADAAVTVTVVNRGTQAEKCELLLRVQPGRVVVADQMLLLAAREAMVEIQGAVIASSLVLLAVFLPVALIPGTTGQLYKQFALTIAASISISLFAALTFAPSLSAMLLHGDFDAALGA